MLLSSEPKIAGLSFLPSFTLSIKIKTTPITFHCWQISKPFIVEKLCLFCHHLDFWFEIRRRNLK